MDRRDFLTIALGGLGALGGLRWSTGDGVVALPLATTADAAQRPPFVRRNVYCLSATSPEIKAYRDAVGAMKARPQTDPTSWRAQANIHGAFNAPAGMIANACRHDPLFFLSWHRMYLHFFERIAREASGFPNFALPYWGYSPTGKRNLPAPFRTPAAATNPLFVATPGRRASINAGGDLSASAVDAGAAMADLAFLSFTGSLNSTPHGVVHGAVGGPGGLMSSFETAGQDPIFWLHHCNIDRLWELWLASGGGRANPTSGPWLTQKFDFYDETGAKVAMSGAEIVDTATQLRYEYASETCRPGRIPVDVYVSRIPTLDPRVLERIRVIRVRPPLPGPPPPLAQVPAVRLGARPTAVRVPVPDAGRQVLARFPEDPGSGNMLALELSDVRLEGAAQVYFEVYVNLPANARDTSYVSPHFVGNVDFFGPSPRGPRAGEQHPRVLNLLPAYVRLRELQRWRDDELRLTFVPRAYVEGEQPARLLGTRQQARIGRIALRVQ